MSIEIKLDTAAVRELIGDDAEARLMLQKAVIANLAADYRRFFKKEDLADIDKMVREFVAARQKTIQQEVDKQIASSLGVIVQPYSSGMPKLPPAMKKEIEAEAKLIASNTWTEEVEKRVGELMSTMNLEEKIVEHAAKMLVNDHTKKLEQKIRALRATLD